ncbi:MAG: polyribonucleotide nucleotidyltransferase [Nitrospirae bacterium RIFCSPHIGHO2_01_FULL_66_17]|nr:MAG: polyribonucleotide nucleotidyltransferase [Nitrospirae bacterium RIFCSPHIGHO2_01_FULL_66_17]
MVERLEMDVAGRQLTIESGRVAKQADGAVLVQMADTVVLVTAVTAKTPRAGVDFLPLTVDYQERAYAAGKIPGGFFKREGRPSEREILSGRLIDRPLRPLFPKRFYHETQVIASVLSADQSNATDFLGIIGASAALSISSSPFQGPVAGIRIGRVDGRFVVAPTLTELEQSTLNVVVAGTRDAVMMVEGEASELPEDVMLEAIMLAHAEIKKIIALQDELVKRVGKPKLAVPKAEADPAVVAAVDREATGPVREALLIPNKTERSGRMAAILADLLARLGSKEAPEKNREIMEVFHDLERNQMRRMILDKGVRADGRGPTGIRAITCEIGVLPRTHGSALFTRGETQSLAVVTLGTSDDEQRIDALEGESKKSFMLHYNFPPFSVGETRPMRGPGRREIGHGALAERALKPVIPTKEKFPYTLRIVSDILESNGSSSMATVCGGTLALMDAGVPISAAVGGIAMGLIKEGNDVEIISDILGVEDHLGDMDFKVTGTRTGVTALQMDIKIQGIDRSIMEKALAQAKLGRLHILDKMAEAIAEPRGSLSTHAPRILMMKVKPDKVREVIGPGGKVIRGIIALTGVKIDVEDDGTIAIASSDEAAARKAIEMIKQITEDVEVGKLYMGKVTRIMEFGAIVEIGPGVDGLVHISQLAPHRVKAVTDEVKEGDEILVKVLEVDRQGKIRLSRKEAMGAAQGTEKA